MIFYVKVREMTETGRKGVGKDGIRFKKISSQRGWSKGEHSIKVKQVCMGCSFYRVINRVAFEKP